MSSTSLGIGEYLPALPVTEQIGFVLHLASNELQVMIIFPPFVYV